MSKKGKKGTGKREQQSSRERASLYGYEALLATELMLNPGYMAFVEECIRNGGKDKPVTAEDIVTFIHESRSGVETVALISNDTRHPHLLKPSPKSKPVPPRFGERILLLILTKEERINIPGDLEEEYHAIAAKHGARYAKLWYYKQVAASVWPLIRKAVGWGLLASVGEWIRRSL